MTKNILTQFQLSYNYDSISWHSILSFYLLFSMMFLFISRDYDLVSQFQLPS